MPRLDSHDWKTLHDDGAPSGHPNLMLARHTGRLRHHRHTNYPALIVMLVLAGLVLGFGRPGSAASVNQGPQAANTAIPTLTAPADNDRLSEATVRTAGTCTPGSFVSLARNNIFAGTAACPDSGRFNLPITLVPATNTITASGLVSGGATTSASKPVTVIYDAPSGQPASIILLRASTGVLLAKSGQAVTRTAVLSGGVPPYAVKWTFGDGSSSVTTQQLEGEVTARHAYRAAGTYNVQLQIDDAAGNSTQIGLVSDITDRSTAFGANSKGFWHGLMSAWPMYVALALLVATFYLGELREALRLRAQVRRARRQVI